MFIDHYSNIFNSHEHQHTEKTITYIHFKLRVLNKIFDTYIGTNK